MKTRRKATTEMFVCDQCGTRKRLESAMRHWCDVCTLGVPVEMRSVRDKWKRPGDEGRPTHGSRF